MRVLEAHLEALALQQACKIEILADRVAHSLVPSGLLVRVAPHQHELTGAQRIVTLRCLNPHTVEREAEHIETAGNDQTLGKTPKLMPGSE
jgi:hypothetical protein